ncbi:SH3 domain-containing protein [Tenacibaculum tangerinum]|uniref:SH3 domain-containing protein n=1 Tax=Tenacibaculum tangerinum TaxID=3038772 RepID=A0ABY8L5K0_9FLAO|nr:SH3 domain-containing protein [Tenacibaculum tangerinum]WGH76691.1 SH3 domain-containing protein [Tenacibaculum tangerinum]
MDQLNRKVLLLASSLMVIAALVIIARKDNVQENVYNTAIVGCYVSPEARCTGSANCRACKNCNYCKHCSKGGSCGVCSGRNQTRNYSNSRKNYPRPKPTERTIFDGRNTTNTIIQEEPYYLKILLVNQNSLNLRSGPDTSYYVIQELNFSEKLSLLSTHGKWIKVKVKKTKAIGFVHYSGVLLVEE